MDDNCGYAIVNCLETLNENMVKLIDAVQETDVTIGKKLDTMDCTLQMIAQITTAW